MDPSRAKTPTIRKFNPGTFQTDEEVTRQFVVREHELGVVYWTCCAQCRFPIVPACPAGCTPRQG